MSNVPCYLVLAYSSSLSVPVIRILGNLETKARALIL